MEILSLLFAGSALVVATVMMAFGLVCWIPGYIIGGITYSGVAKRRGVERPWLACVPVGYAWLYGAIADQYRQAAYGEVSSRRTVLLWLTVASTACGLLNVLSQGFLPFAVLAIAAGVTQTVYHFIVMYDFFRSCDPDKAKLYLLLSIFSGGLLTPIFLLLCWKKDLGMSPVQTSETAEEADVDVIPAEEPEIVSEAE